MSRRHEMLVGWNPSAFCGQVVVGEVGHEKSGSSPSFSRQCYAICNHASIVFCICVCLDCWSAMAILRAHVTECNHLYLSFLAGVGVVVGVGL